MFEIIVGLALLPVAIMVGLGLLWLAAGILFAPFYIVGQGLEAAWEKVEDLLGITARRVAKEKA